MCSALEDTVDPWPGGFIPDGWRGMGRIGYIWADR